MVGWISCKIYGDNRPQPSSRLSICICLERPKQITKNLSQISKGEVWTRVFLTTKQKCYPFNYDIRAPSMLDDVVCKFVVVLFGLRRY
jgi:hypothetical protein